MSFSGYRDPSKHACDLRNSVWATDTLQHGFRTTFLHEFRHDVLGGSCCGDLREVGDAENLMSRSEFPHLRGDPGRDLTADIGINLVEDEQGNPVLIGKGGFQGKHHTGNLAAGGDGAQAPGRLPGIRGEEKLGKLAPIRPGFRKLFQSNLESGLPETEIGKLGDHGL